MSLEADALLDRRRLQRRVSLWRMLALGLAAVAVVALTLRATGALSLTGRTHIARLTVSGLITDDHARLKMLKRIAKSKRVAALLVHVNSPGGTTTGGESLFEGLREVAAKKPVVAVMGTMATSAAFITGLACDHIVARGNTVTGSVGVILQWAEISQLLDKLGVRMNEVKSGPLKAVPSIFQPVDEAGRKVAGEMVAESQRWFVSLVASRRNIDTAGVPGLLEGRIFSGRQALEHKLIDAIGGEDDAIKWLETKRGVAKSLPVVDWKPSSEGTWSLSGLLVRATAALAGASGEALMEGLAGQGAVTRLQLDGLVSVWHAPAN